MNYITHQTRQLSFEDIQDKKEKRKKQILSILSIDFREMTAKEVAVEMFELGWTPSNERNYSAPRLTDLEDEDKVEVIGKKKCDYTGKTVAIYKITQKGYENLNFNHIPRLD